MSEDEELRAVKRELSKLKSCTIWTIPRHKPNRIIDVSDSRGFYIQATSTPKWVTWNEVLGKYAQLRREGTLVRNKEKQDRGAFVMPLLARLSTVEITSVPQRTNHYVREGLPVRLR